MGVDFYTCYYCNEAFPDCGYFFTCNCGHHYCDKKCGEAKCINYINNNGKEVEKTTCRICRYEYIPDNDLLKFILERFSLTREAVEELYRNSVEKK